MAIEQDGTVCCDKCGKRLVVGEYPFCPHGMQANSVIGDEIDVWVAHGICNDDGSPRHFTSREAMKKEAEKRGWTNRVEHIGQNGTDKSKHTTRWV